MLCAHTARSQLDNRMKQKQKCLTFYICDILPKRGQSGRREGHFVAAEHVQFNFIYEAPIHFRKLSHDTYQIEPVYAEVLEEGRSKISK